MSASLAGSFHAMARNNAWANHRLGRACLALSDAEFVAPRCGFFPSIAATLNHMLTVDWFYVDALEAGTLGPTAWANPLPYPTASGWQAAQAAVDIRLVTVCAGFGDGDFDAIVAVHRGVRVQTERRDRLLLHLFQHQIHHRGQAHAMLSATTVKPPQLDEFYSAAEAPLREAEFSKLGWTEDMVWQAAGWER